MDVNLAQRPCLSGVGACSNCLNGIPVVTDFNGRGLPWFELYDEDADAIALNTGVRQTAWSYRRRTRCLSASGATDSSKTIRALELQPQPEFKLPRIIASACLRAPRGRHLAKPGISERRVRIVKVRYYRKWRGAKNGERNAIAMVRESSRA